MGTKGRRGQSPLALRPIALRLLPFRSASVALVTRVIPTVAALPSPAVLGTQAA